MKHPDELSEAFEMSPFVTSTPARRPARRCRCQSRPETEWSGEPETDGGSWETTPVAATRTPRRRARCTCRSPQEVRRPGEGETDGESWEAEPAVLTETDQEWEDEYPAANELEDEAGSERFESPYVLNDEDEETPAPQALRARIVEVARREFDTWGRGTKTETDPAMHAALRPYWETVLKGSAVADAIKNRNPWSAAFVSYVMRRAGAGDAFSGSPAHYLYIGAAKRARAQGDHSKFHAYAITEVAPEVGDVVCRDRSAGGGKCGGTTYANVDDRSYHPTHCDIVTEVRPGSISVIGGNVGGKACPTSGCTVNERTIKLDARGFVIPRPGGCAYFAILKAPGAPRTSPVPVPGGSAQIASFAIPSPRGYRQSGGRRTGSKIRAIIVHTTGSGLAAKAEANRNGAGRGCTTALDCGLEYYGPGGAGGFPHYLIGYDGTAYATCPEDYLAYHAGWVKEIGGKDAWAPGRWSAPAWWAKVWGANKTPLDLIPPGASGPNSQSIGIELLGQPKDGAYTGEQYRSLARLIVDIDRRHGIGIDRAPSPKLLGHEDVNPLTGKFGRANAQGGWDPGAHSAKPRFSWPDLWALIEQQRTGRELEDEDEAGPGDAESAFVGESWETAASEELEDAYRG